jgi:hypothetical protein
MKRTVHPNRHVVFRLNAIALLCLQTRGGCSIWDLCDKLECAVRSINRDLDFLRYSLRHDLRYNERTHRWFYGSIPLSLCDPKRFNPV